MTNKTIALFEAIIGKNPDAFLHEPVYQVTESELLELARQIAAPEAPHQDSTKGSGSLEFDGLLAEFHAAVWNGSEDGVCYDMAGVDIAKKLQAMFRARGDQPQGEPAAVVNLRNFANSMIDIALEGGDADGIQIQELAVEHGLLKPEQRTERCGESCSCAEYADFPVECFRKVKDLIPLIADANGKARDV